MEDPITSKFVDIVKDIHDNLVIFQIHAAIYNFDEEAILESLKKSMIQKHPIRVIVDISDNRIQEASLI